MYRSTVKWVLALTGLVGLSVGSASAQFVPGFRPGVFWRNPITGQQFAYNFHFNTALRWNAVNPVTGHVTMFNFQQTWTGLPPSMLYPRYTYNPYGLTATPYLSGGAGTYYNSNSLANPFVRDQVRMFAAAGEQNRKGEGGGGQRVIADQFNYERRAKPDRAAAVPAEVNQALLEPADEAVLSGRVLNELVNAIQALEENGARAESPLLPAELLKHVNLSSGPNADVLMMIRGGRPVFPSALSEAGYDRVKEDLERAMGPVVEAVSAGKKADQAAIDRLEAAVRRARTDLAPAIRNSSFQDGAAVVRFLNGLEALAKTARHPSDTGLFPPKWSTLGATVAELVGHMNKFQLAFTPATPEGEAAYYSLHRGFATYYLALAGSKR